MAEAPSIEGSLWKLKSSLTGASWKKHWVFTDGTKICQWHSRSKPSITEVPKYSLYLKDCKISDYQGRKYCFKISENNSNLALVLAVDDFDSYEKWLKILIRNENEAPEDVDGPGFPADFDIEDADPLDAAEEEQKKEPVEESRPDLILDYFKQHDVYQNVSNPCIPVRQVQELLHQLDGSLNVGVLVRLLLRDFNTHRSGVLAYADFLSWWDAYKSVPKPGLNQKGDISTPTIEPNTIVGINSPEAVHLVGFIDPTAHKDTLRSAFLTHLRLPPNDAILDSIVLPQLDEVTDWNDVYQSSTERVDALSAQFLTRLPGDDLDEVHEEEEEHLLEHGDEEKSTYGEQSHVSHPGTVLSAGQSAVASEHASHHTSRTHSTHHTHNTHQTHNTHTSTYLSHPTQVSRNTAHTPLPVHPHVLQNNAVLPPAFGGSRNTIAYPSVVSRDGYISPSAGSVVSQGQSLASHTYAKSQDHAHSVHSLSPKSLGGKSTQSAAPSAKSQASHGFHRDFKHPPSPHTTLAPLPEGSYHTEEDAQSERSFDTRDTADIHRDALNHQDEYNAYAHHHHNNINTTSAQDGYSVTEEGSQRSERDLGNHIPSESEQWTELVEACVHVSAVKGAFYRTAIDGVRCIIDEYCLPDEMKSATKLSPDLVDTEGFHALALGENANSTTVEVYALSGMLFSIAACPASTADAPSGSGSGGVKESAHAGKTEGPPAQEMHVSFQDTHHTASNTTVAHTSTHTNAATLARQALVSASDEVQHKVAGNEVRNTDLLQATINLLYAQTQLAERVNRSNAGHENNEKNQHDAEHATSNANISLYGSTLAPSVDPESASVADSYVSGMPPPLPPGAISTNPKDATTTSIPVLRPTTLLTTVVDYAGFRVTVLCPTLIEEHSTLVHGPSTIHVTGPDVLDTVSNDSTKDNNTSTTLHVRAAPEVPPLLSSLAKSLNLHIYQRPRPVTLQRLHERETDDINNNATETPLVRNIDLLTTDIQVHESPEGRLYVLNLKNLLPNALPRPHSYDVQTRQLRAEYVKHLDYALKCDILQQSMQFALDGAAPHSIDIRAERVVIQEAGYNLTACRELFSHTLPQVASLLDQYASIPLDSYGFTQFLHTHGVNCRHMGVLYWLCNSSSVKALILSEALARCAKTVLNAQLRAHARKIKGSVLRAQHRGRSVQHDYTEYVQNANLTHRATVLELFNLVLGWGPQSDAFWKATLLDALDQKFGIQATKAHLLTHLHMPQLFLAMQYHTGTRFQDNPVYNLNTTVVVNPFNTQHILEYFIPTTKVTLNISSEIGQVCTHADSLLLNGLYSESASAFKLKVLLYSALFPEVDTNIVRHQNGGTSDNGTSHSGASGHKISSALSVRSPPPVYQFALAHLVYKCALSQYLSHQYVAAYYTLRKYLTRSVRYHATTGRILSLLMCVSFKLQRLDKAVQYFDAAQEVYTYTLGANHPILCIHTMLLADLYDSIHAASHGKALRLLAHVTAQKSLGEKHLITALYEYRLAATYIQQSDYLTALPYLENCIEIFSAAVVESGAFAYEAAVCLYNTSVCLSLLGDVDRAGQLALKSVELARNMDCRKVNVYPMLVSGYLLLSDLALSKNQPHAAVGLLEQLWNYLQKVPPSYAQRRYIGDVQAVLSKRILCLLVAHMTMASRSLFDSVVSDWHKQQYTLAQSAHKHQLQHQLHNNNQSDEDITVSTMDPQLQSEIQHSIVEVWDSACKAVFSAMLEHSPSEYFERIMLGIQEYALSTQEHNVPDDGSVDSPTLILANSKKITFAAQAAVVSQLVFNAQEGASHNFIHI